MAWCRAKCALGLALAGIALGASVCSPAVCIRCRSCCWWRPGSFMRGFWRPWACGFRAAVLDGAGNDKDAAVSPGGGPGTLDDLDVLSAADPVRQRPTERGGIPRRVPGGVYAADQPRCHVRVPAAGHGQGGCGRACEDGRLRAAGDVYLGGPGLRALGSGESPLRPPDRTRAAGTGPWKEDK